MIIILCVTLILWLIRSHAVLYSVNSMAVRVHKRSWNLVYFVVPEGKQRCPHIVLNVLFLISFGRVKWGVSCSLSEQ